MSPERPQLSLLRGPQTARGWQRWGQRLSESWSRSLELPAVWVGLFLAFGTWSLVPDSFRTVPRIAAGMVATQDYVATRDLLIQDEETTRDKQQRAQEAVLPVYDFDPGVETERDAQIAELFERGRRSLAADPAPLGEPSGLQLHEEQRQLLVGRRFSAELEDRLRGAFHQVMRRGVVSNKGLLLENRLRGITLRNLATGAESAHFDLFDHLGYPDEVRDLLETEIRGWPGWSAAERRRLAAFLLDNVPVNLQPNRGETQGRKEAAVAATDPVFIRIRDGEVIVRAGDLIKPAQARAITQIRGGDRRPGSRFIPILGHMLFLGLIGLMLFLGLNREKVADHSRLRIFNESLFILLVALLGSQFLFVVSEALANSFEGAPFDSVRSYLFAVPFAALALLSALLLGRNVALLHSFAFSLIASRLSEGGALWPVLYCAAGSLAAVFALDRLQFKQRLVIARVGVVVGLVNLLAVLVLAALDGAGERSVLQLGFDLVCAAAGGLGVAVVVSFAVPVLEWMLEITTDIKLVELSNTNLPLLRRLAFEAPGTFQHSLMVANLAKEGCEAIGADPVLAYAGGLYHDVGKIFRPDYFIENQRHGQNRHDKLLPSLSALVLISHVKDGVQLAREHHLPKSVQDAIREHHGTRLIKYFYNRALERSDPSTGEVQEEKYRYPGPRPHNKVMGVLMLADAVEAASRTLIEPTPSKLQTLIRTISEDCLRDNQLDESELTLSDLNKVSEAFLRTLSHLFHQRIDYPGFDFNAEPRRDRRFAAQAR